jgi:hypothetical protein
LIGLAYFLEVQEVLAELVFVRFSEPVEVILAQEVLLIVGDVVALVDDFVDDRLL